MASIKINVEEMKLNFEGGVIHEARAYCEKLNDEWIAWTFDVELFSDDKIKPAFRDNEGAIHPSPYADGFKVGLPNASF